MIKGIQITKSANENLLNSIWLLDNENNEARCLVAPSHYSEDQVIPVSELGEYESREINLQQPQQIEGGQHL